VKAPEPLYVHWRGREVRVRHDDPDIGVYTPAGARLRAAIHLASDVEGLRLVLASTVGDRYRVRVSEDGTVVGLWRRSTLVRGGPGAGHDPASRPS
jgi:hypothetical protein